MFKLAFDLEHCKFHSKPCKLIAFFCLSLSSILSLCKRRFVSVWLNENLYFGTNFVCLFVCLPDTQHGTEWASSPCSVCSCNHGEVRCTPQPCPPLSCGHQELAFIPEGSCCPVCVGPGSEYELVEVDPLCLGGSHGNTPTLLFFAQCGSKIS